MKINKFICDFCGKEFNVKKNYSHISINTNNVLYIDFMLCNSCRDRVVKQLEPIKEWGISIREYYTSLLNGDESVTFPRNKYNGKNNPFSK